MADSPTNSDYDFSSTGVFGWIAQGFENIIKAITSVLDYINPFSDNFILKGVLDFLGNILSYINPFSDNFILKDVLKYLNPFSDDFILKGVLDFFATLISYINPFSENFIGYKLVELIGNLLQKLFVPSEDSFNQFSEIWNSKLGFIETIKINFNAIKNMFNNLNVAPKFTMNINSKYYSGDLVVIDLSWYTPYKPYGDVVITAFIYVLFIFRLIKHLPSIVSGVGSFGDTADDIVKTSKYID